MYESREFKNHSASPCSGHCVLLILCVSFYLSVTDLQTDVLPCVRPIRNKLIGSQPHLHTGKGTFGGYHTDTPLFWKQEPVSGVARSQFSYLTFPISGIKTLYGVNIQYIDLKLLNYNTTSQSTLSTQSCDLQKWIFYNKVTDTPLVRSNLILMTVGALVSFAVSRRCEWSAVMSISRAGCGSWSRLVE